MDIDQILDKFYLAMMDNETVTLSSMDCATVYEAFRNRNKFKIGDRVTWGSKASSFVIDSFGERNGQLHAYMKGSTGIFMATGEPLEWGEELQWCEIRRLDKVED